MMQMLSLLRALLTLSTTILSSIPTDMIDAIIVASGTVSAAVIGLISAVMVVKRKKGRSSEQHREKGKPNKKDQSQKKPDYAQIHRESLLADPHITSLPTLDSYRKSVGFDKLYIELRLYSEYSLSDEIETACASDPNKLLQASQERLEKFAGSAKSPEDAICEDWKNLRKRHF